MLKYLILEKSAANRNGGWETAKEIVGTIILTAIIIVFCAICIVGSGYHWE